MGSFLPVKGNRKFIIVVVDYFTRWVEVEALATTTIDKVITYLWKFIISKFGIPRVLIIDNDTQFNNKKFRDFYDELQINHRFSSMSHPQTNWQVEVSNREILKGIKKKVERVKGAWGDELMYILWALRTMEKSTIGETPFLLTYGVNALILVKIEAGSLLSLAIRRNRK